MQTLVAGVCYVSYHLYPDIMETTLSVCVGVCEIVGGGGEFGFKKT